MVLGSAVSDESILACGVPQGSGFGHTKPTVGIVTRRGMNNHYYSDDIQIYLSVDQHQSTEAILTKVELCC